MAEKKADFTAQYAALLNSPFGEDIKRVLTDYRDSLIDDAGKADNQERAYGLLKQASGVMLALSHLEGRAKTVTSKARRNGGA